MPETGLQILAYTAFKGDNVKKVMNATLNTPLFYFFCFSCNFHIVNHAQANIMCMCSMLAACMQTPAHVCTFNDLWVMNLYFNSGLLAAISKLYFKKFT